MKNRLRLVFAMMAGLLAGSGSLVAHHGAAAYDAQNLTTLAATVTEFDWKNPHALLRFDVADANGAIAHWTAETAGLVILVRAGWKRDVLKPGDRITVIGRRAINGSTNMILQRLTMSTGRELISFVPPR